MIRDDLEEKKEETIEIDDVTSVSEFLDARGIERQEVLVARNGKIISSSHILEEGDTIEVFDVIAGG